MARSREAEEADLEARMAQAIADQDFEAAARLRDLLEAMRDGSRLRSHVPGKMGLGTSDQKMRPPPGWKPPKKPDPMTRNTKPRGGKG